MKKYKVMNPNKIPKGIRIIAWGNHEWFEGDDFTAPPGLNIDRLVRDGFIKEAKTGVSSG